MGYRVELVRGLHMINVWKSCADLGTMQEPPNPRWVAGACGWQESQPTILFGVWIARRVPCEPRGLTVSHACDPRMHHEPEILNHTYAKTVKLNPVISTQDQGVEKP